jgi:hypothetical protein
MMSMEQLAAILPYMFQEGGNNWMNPFDWWEGTGDWAAEGGYGQYMSTPDYSSQELSIEAQQLAGEQTYAGAQSDVESIYGAIGQSGLGGYIGDYLSESNQKLYDTLATTSMKTQQAINKMDVSNLSAFYDDIDVLIDLDAFGFPASTGDPDTTIDADWWLYEPGELGGDVSQMFESVIPMDILVDNGFYGYNDDGNLVPTDYLVWDGSTWSMNEEKWNFGNLRLLATYGGQNVFQGQDWSAESDIEGGEDS